MKIKKIQDVLKMKEYLPKPKMRLEDFVDKNIVIVKAVPKMSKKYEKPGFVLTLKTTKDTYDVFTCASYVVKQVTDIVQQCSELGQQECVILCKVAKKYNSLVLIDYDGNYDAKGDVEDGSAKIPKE